MSRRHPDAHRTPGDEPSYSLDELTALAGVTVRTVRYYIAEGLLPPPESLGRHATYSHEHLERLLLIGQLKEEFLPLKEIRRRLQAMSREEITAAVTASRSAVAAEEDPGSAARYIERALRDEQPRYRPSRAGVPRPVPSPAPAATTWRRLPISDEAELLITNDAYDRRGTQVDAALTWIRRILDES